MKDLIPVFNIPFHETSNIYTRNTSENKDVADKKKIGINGLAIIAKDVDNTI